MSEFAHRCERYTNPVIHSRESKILDYFFTSAEPLSNTGATPTYDKNTDASI